jgi:protein-disulfide isomerase
MKKTAALADIPPANPTTGKTPGYWELKIPHVNLQNAGTNAYLVFALVIFSFFLGMLTNKVMYLEQQATIAPNANNAAAGDEPLPTVEAPPQVVNVGVGKLPLRGDQNAKVTIVEFSDLQCPFCKTFFDDTYAKIDEKYIKTGKVKFTYRHYPLTSIHPLAQKSAEATECANEQGKFWEYHDKLFAMQDTWSSKAATDAITTFVTYAEELGLDATQFQSCLESNKYKKAVDVDTAAGSQAQVDGTPAFFVNGYRMVGAQPFSEFERVIEEQLKK